MGRLSKLPESLVVLGGGYVAVELAQMFSRLGSRVSIVARSGLLAGYEPDLGRMLADARSKRPFMLFIELGSRRIHLSASTAHSDSAWVTQQARNLAMALDDRAAAIRFLIHDQDTKFSRSFDAVVRSEGARVILTPIRAPNANAYAERVIEPIRAECLDWTLILGRRHLDQTLRTYAAHYNRGRPHRGLALETPLAEPRDPVPVSPRDVRRQDLLGGPIHEYHGLAA